MRFFGSKDSLNNHFAKRSDGWDCEVCNKTRFFGPECFMRHRDHNCKAPENAKVDRCSDCGRDYLNELHDCNAWGNCRNCDEEFRSKSEKSNHDCYYQPLEKYWESVTEKQWNSNWFYDFETTRGEQVKDNEWRHEVMAWCMKLMQPDDATKTFVKNNNVWEKINENLKETTFNDIQHDNEKIWGKDLQSFIYIAENIIASNKRDFKWKPTLWAHNGSKFDVKFILDYYLNDQNMDLAGDKYEEEFSSILCPEMEEGIKKWKQTKFKSKRNVINLNMVNSKVLQMTVRGVRYRCSHAHFVGPLRDLPKTFNLPIDVKKGEFPYGRLNRDNWGKTMTAPLLTEYDIDAMPCDRREAVINWYRNQSDDPWNFDDNLWSYLFADVDVGCAALEAYHQKADEMHCDLWRKYPERLDKMVSPLSFSTAPGWALAMYRTWFLPENIISILRPNEARFIRDSLRGGRTDKRCNWIQLTPDQIANGDRIEYYDFVSLYPSVQKGSVHNTYYPKGRPQWLKWKGPTNNQQFLQNLGNKTGFIRISTKVLKYTTHPTLHRVGSYDEDDQGKKLLFELRDKVAETYATPEIIEAIESEEIEVTFIHEGLLFDKTVNIFNDYVDFFFAVKDEASKKINGEVSNPGLRWLAKLLLNSLWGKLGQRSYHIKEWVEYAERHDYILSKFESGEWEMINCIPKDDHRAHYEYRIIDDYNNLNNTAYQIACYVSMWGRVMLHKKLLRPHGMRALYSDTDSAILYLRGCDKMSFLGEELGQLSNELPKLNKSKLTNARITEVVFLAPKTYAIKIVGDDGEDYKVVCKGFEPSYRNGQFINFESMKRLVFSKYRINQFLNKKRGYEEEGMDKQYSIKGERRLTFKSSLARNEIVPVEAYIQKEISGDYTKGTKHPFDPRFISPYGNIKAGRETFLDSEAHFF